MVAVAWTAIGCLAATLFGNLYWLGGRIDALGARIDARLDAINARLDGMNARLDEHIHGRGPRRA